MTHDKTPVKRAQLAVVLLLLTGMSLGVAVAQEPNASAQPRVLSQGEQISAARGVVNRGSDLARRVSAMLDEARRESDIIRLTCLNDKLTQVNANLRNAQFRLASLEKQADSNQRNHELTVVTVLGQKFQLLDQEANQCVGQDLYEAGTTKVVTEIDQTYLPFEKNPSSPPIQLPPGVPDVPPASGDR